MTASQYASDAKIAEACTALGADLIGQTEQTLLQQLVVAAATASGGGGGATAWGVITGTLSAQTDLQSALDAKANIAGGNTFSGAQVITSGTITGLTNFGVAMANNTAMTGFALGTISDTTARPLIVSQTFNNASLSGCALRVDITDTSSADLSPFFQINRGGSRFLSVSKKTSWGISNMPCIEGDGSAAGQIAFNSSHGSVILARKDVGWSFCSMYDGSFVPSGSKLGFATNTTAGNVTTQGDAFFTRASAASIKMGAAHATTATDQTFSAHNVTTGTAASLTIKGGDAGSGTGGDLILRGGTGTSANGSIKLGSASSDMIGFWGNAVDQPAAVTDLAGTSSVAGSDTVSESTILSSLQTIEGKVNDLLARIRELGLIAT